MRILSRRTPNVGRHGMTMLEVVIVISIIGLLLAILVPAIQSMRETSRRSTCLVRLKELGVAIHGYEGARQQYPPALAADHAGHATPGHFSPQARLLPYLEQSVLYQRIDFESPQHTVYDPASTGGPNAELFRIPVAAFVCPSDDRGDGRAPCNYRVCMGPGPYWVKSPNQPGGGTGPFSGLKAHLAAEFHDGLGQTVAMSERLTGGWNPADYDSRRDFWYSGVRQLVGYNPPLDEMIDVCAALTSSTPDFYPFSGATWLIGDYSYTWYNHAVPPNSRIPACTEVSASNTVDGAPIMNGGVFTASSHHPGGVNCLFMDGSVKFVNDGIDLGVWRSMATRAGHEVVTVADL